MKKRRSLKQLFLTRILLSVVMIIAIITAVSMKRQSDEIVTLTESLLARESISYSSEIYNWWSLIECRVQQIADVLRNSPKMSHEDELNMLLSLTAADPDSQDIYLAYGDDMTFLDGSGWIPGDDFVFTDRAWYQGALGQGGQIYTSDPYVDASTGKTCLACAIMIENNVVLSSDITFDQMAEKMAGFKASSSDVKIYIINSETQDVLLSTDESTVGTVVSGSTDPVLLGLGKVLSSIDTTKSMDSGKIKTVDTSAGKMMYAATEVEGTNWLVVSATPYRFVSDKILSSALTTLIISLILLALLAVFLYFVIRNHLDPVSTVTGKIGDLSSGDFTTDITPEGNDEITTLSEQLNGYISRMRDMLIHLTAITDDMNGSVEKCFNISGGLNESNSTQGESIGQLNEYLDGLNQSIEDVANAATELAAVSSKLAENSEEVRNLCVETVKSSEDGRAEMKGMTQSVTTLNSTIGELIKIIRTTADTVDEIKGITDTIGDISSQTNLLSLNASIEAARAGEMGRGFAVVASEVGALANQSTGAASNISSLVETITENIEDINKKADDCLRDMEQCLAGVERSNASFDTIYEDITKATDAISDITDGIGRINDVASNNAAATQEQAATINQILSLSDSIVSESGKISAETENLSNESQKLNGYSAAIVEDLKNFTLG
ncbi:MAG: methyl-accepting chemotaxis protein [Lachnospiraceae bacterium]|nr:methyl-accepting chemotaxis protein [Lachnospiraceae bacterium]